MSAAHAGSRSADPFSGRTVFWGVFASLLAAAGFFLLSTYAPDFRRPDTDGATPYSRSGVGYAGLMRLIELTDQAPVLSTNLDSLYRDTLLVVMLSPRSDMEAVDRILAMRRDGLPTLFVLPKWQTRQLPLHDGWVETMGRLPAGEVNRWLEKLAGVTLGTARSSARRLNIAGHGIDAPAELQWVTRGYDVRIGAGSREALLVEPRTGVFVLTDPDILNNAALKDPVRAKAALALIKMIYSGEDPILFDTTVHNPIPEHDLAKLLVEPPFLALTLAVLATAALAFAHSIVRFGPTLPDRRALALGKRALVDTTAMLLRRSGRLGELGARYAALVRTRAAARLGPPKALQGEALDRWLCGQDRGEPQAFSALVHAAEQARDVPDMHDAAKGLHSWLMRRIRDH